MTITKSGGRKSQYGSMRVVDNTDVTTIPSQNEWVIVDVFTDGINKGVSYNSNSLVTSRGGDYSLACSGTGNPSSANTNFEITVFKNGELVDKTDLPVRFGASQNQPFALTGFILQLSKNDTVSIRIRNLDDNSNITITNCSVRLVLLL